MNLITRRRLPNLISSCLLFLSVTFWLYSRSKPIVDSEIPSSTPQTFNISSELSSISNRLSYIWITTCDNILRKCSLSSNYRYGFYSKSITIRTSSCGSYYLVTLLPTRVLVMIISFGVFPSMPRVFEVPQNYLTGL
jgi:hypothetical protein